MWNPNTNRVLISRDIIWLKRMYFEPKVIPEIEVQPAIEVSENVTQDCMQPLKDLMISHDKEFQEVETTSNKMIDRLHALDYAIKQTAMTYFKAAQHAEESVARY